VRAQEVKEEVQRLEIEQGEQSEAFEEEKAKRDAELVEELKRDMRTKEAAAKEATKVRGSSAPRDAFTREEAISRPLRAGQPPTRPLAQISRRPPSPGVWAACELCGGRSNSAPPNPWC
jgi:hypothetical protein